MIIVEFRDLVCRCCHSIFHWSLCTLKFRAENLSNHGFHFHLECPRDSIFKTTPPLPPVYPKQLWWIHRAGNHGHLLFILFLWNLHNGRHANSTEVPQIHFTHFFCRKRRPIRSFIQMLSRIMAKVVCSTVISSASALTVLTFNLSLYIFSGSNQANKGEVRLFFCFIYLPPAVDDICTSFSLF